MSPTDVAIFIRQWHEAIFSEIADENEESRLREDAAALAGALGSDSHLRSVNPLLCALLCALNRERRHQLPRSRLTVYRAALAMLLERRDREREVFRPGDLSADEAIFLLQDLAAYLVRNGWADIDISRATLQIERSLRSLRNIDAHDHSPEDTMRSLIERSGILREIMIGRVDFIHKAFQELLAAKHIVENDEIGLLVAKSDDDQWRDVVIFAVAQMTAKQANEFITELLSAHPKNIPLRDKLLLLACLQNIVALDPELRARVMGLAETLIPPNNIETAQEPYSKLCYPGRSRLWRSI
jgi:predicted NACHT family NTPase